jgi:protein TonB
VRLVSLFLIASAGVIFADHPARTTAPVPIHSVSPEYTQEASEAKLQGSVLLSAVVGVDGIPADIKVVKGLGMGLDEKAVECLSKWRFKPGTHDAQPTTVRVQVQINFRLLEKPK